MAQELNQTLTKARFLVRCLRHKCISCHASKLGMGSEQDTRTTIISLLLTLRFKCRTAYLEWLKQQLHQQDPMGVS